MRALWVASILFLLGVCPMQSGHAQQIDSLNWGVRAGGIMPAYEGAEFATALGGGVLYRHREWPGFALELDLAITVVDGEVVRRDFFASTLSGYLAWRSAGPWYLKVRGGMLAEYIEVGSADDWGSGLSGGIGVGLRHNESLLELELTGIEESAYMVSLAYYF